MSYDILDSAVEKDFDNLAELIAQVCNCPYALITFMDRDRHWFKAKRQVEINEIPRNMSFCSYTILQDEVMVVYDTKKDKRFFDNPHVVGEPKILFYAGAPIISAAGYKIGSVCAMDKKAKTIFTPEQANALKIIAQQVTALLELRVQNKLIVAKSNALIAEEKKIALLTLTRQDEEKNFIANELHENFAQTLAATKLYLDFAEHSKELSVDFIKKSKTNILQIIKEIKTLSKSMLPSTFLNANYLEFIQEMLKEYGIQNNKKITFHHEGKLDCYNANTGLTLFRIIQYQLKYAHQCGAKNISIKVKTSKTIDLKFVDDGKNVNSSEPERKMLLHQIEIRTGIEKGRLKVRLDSRGRNLLEIEIPFENEL